MGETPNLAARLQPGRGRRWWSPSRRGDCLATALTRPDLGAHDLKGSPHPVQAWQVVGERSTEGRFEALHGMWCRSLAAIQELAGPRPLAAASERRQ